MNNENSILRKSFFTVLDERRKLENQVKRIPFSLMRRMGYFLSKEILEVHTQLILIRKHLYQVVHAKIGLRITYHANIFFLCSFQNVVGDGTPYLQVFGKALSSAVTTQL